MEFMAPETGRARRHRSGDGVQRLLGRLAARGAAGKSVDGRDPIAPLALSVLEESDRVGQLNGVADGLLLRLRSRPQMCLLTIPLAGSSTHKVGLYGAEAGKALFVERLARR